MSPSDVDKMLDKAYKLLGNAEYDKAIELFSEVIGRQPNMEGAWGNRGYALLELGRDKEALADFDMALTLNEKDAWAHAFRSQALYYLGRFEEALETASKALEFAGEEDVGPARWTRAFLFIRAGQFEAACDDLEVYCEKAPKDDAMLDLLDICQRVRDTGDHSCELGPNGCLHCSVCQHAQCGFSFNHEPNPAWREQGGRCEYEHCIETMPLRGGDGPGICPVFGHDCPGGIRRVRTCPVAAHPESAEDDSLDPKDDNFHIEDDGPQTL